MIHRSYNVKKGYVIREKNAPFPDVQPTGTIYQPDVYELAKFIARRKGLKYIIDIGAGSGDKIKDIEDEFNIIAVDCDTNIDLLRKNLPKSQVIEHDFEKGLPVIDQKVLEQSLVMSIDVIEHIVEPHKYLKALSDFSKIAPYLLISTPDRTRARGADHFGPPGNPFHVREWTIDELNGLLQSYDIAHQIGFTKSNDEENFKATILAVAGKDNAFAETKNVNVLGIVTAYNESDILGQSVQHLLNQGLRVHVVDNWSTDGSYELVKKMSKNNNNLSVERFPAKKPKEHVYKWESLLQRVEKIAKSSNADWIMHNDADELRVSPWRSVRLMEAISFVDSLGYDAIDFTVADFRPTKDGFSSKDNPEEFFHDFEFVDKGGYFQQIKGWKNHPDVSLAPSGGHHAYFPDQKIFPLKFLNKHYPLRSTNQAKRKIFKERKTKFDKTELEKGWHIQYDGYNEDASYIWNEVGLNKFTYGHFFDEYIVERLSGIGIRKSK